MNFLFDNPFTNLSGPVFLWLYGAIITFSILLFQILKSQIDKTAQMPLPPIPNKPDAYKIAFLRGGENELARTVIFALIQKGFLQVLINEADKVAWIQQTEIKPEKKLLNYLEQNVYNWFEQSRKIKEFFANDGLPQIIRPFAVTYTEQLEQNNLLTSSDLQSRTRKMKWFIFLNVIGLGFYKLIAALLGGHSNVGFLILFGFVALVIFGSMRELPRLTKHGKSYLERLQLAFERFKMQIPRNSFSNVNRSSEKYSNATFNGFEPALLAVGLFGVNALSGTIYDEYRQAFHKANQASASSSSSCGSGYGSSWDSSSSNCSSSDGGSSCGGGCGGGCGGCS